MSVPKKTISPVKPTNAGVLDIINPKKLKEKGPLWTVGGSIVFIGILLFAIAEYWGDEEPRFNVLQVAMQDAGVENPKDMPLGYAYASAIIHIADILLHKPGGFLSNDMFPPGVLEDNMPQWEYGVLTSLRDGTIKLHGPAAFEGMRRAGRLAAETLDALAPMVVPGVTTAADDPMAIKPSARFTGAKHSQTSGSGTCSRVRSPSSATADFLPRADRVPRHSPSRPLNSSSGAPSGRRMTWRR